MSIISDALAQLQAERDRLKSFFPDRDSARVFDHPSRSLSKLRHPLSSTRTYKILLLGSVGLGVLGFGIYWWGLMMVAPVPLVQTVSHQLAPTLDETSSQINSPRQSEHLKGSPESSFSSDKTREPISDQPPSPSQEIESPVTQLKASQSSASKEISRLSSYVSQDLEGSEKGNGLESQMGKHKQDTRSKSPTTSSQRSLMPKPRRDPALGPIQVTNGLSMEKGLAVSQILIKKRQYGQAVTILRSLLKSEPNDWEPWFWMGTAKLGLGQLDEADQFFIDGLARNGTVPHLWVQRALVGQQRGRYWEAIEALRQAEILAPDLPEVPLNLAYSFETQGNTVLAIEYYRKFLSMTERTPAYRAARKKVLVRIIKLKQA